MIYHVTITRDAWLRLLDRVEALEREVAALRAESASRAERAEADDPILHWHERTR